MALVKGLIRYFKRGVRGWPPGLRAGEFEDGADHCGQADKQDGVELFRPLQLCAGEDRQAQKERGPADGGGKADGGAEVEEHVFGYAQAGRADEGA